VSKIVLSSTDDTNRSPKGTTGHKMKRYKNMQELFFLFSENRQKTWKMYQTALSDKHFTVNNQPPNT
jgi:hypothetical protein